MPGKTQERLLDDVLDIVRIAKQPAAYASDERAMVSTSRS
jgi:hypothetical protein